MVERGKLFYSVLDGDKYYSLKDLNSITNELIQIYGENSLIIADAGYSNVDFNIDTRKYMIEDYKKGKLN